MSISLTVLINYTTEKSRSNVTTVAIHTPSSHSLVSKHRPSTKEARTLGRKADSQLGQDKTNVSLKQVSTVLNIWGKQNATSAFSEKASHKIYRTLHVWNKNTLQTQNVNHTLLSKRCLDSQNNPRTHWAQVRLVRSAVGTACAVCLCLRSAVGMAGATPLCLPGPHFLQPPLQAPSQTCRHLSASCTQTFHCGETFRQTEEEETREGRYWH